MEIVSKNIFKKLLSLRVFTGHIQSICDYRIHSILEQKLWNVIDEDDAIIVLPLIQADIFFNLKNEK